jgi:hypothetical protein
MQRTGAAEEAIPVLVFQQQPDLGQQAAWQVQHPSGWVCGGLHWLGWLL